ncbi:hypothetical protein D3C85_1028340 [compost metagenome]
MEAISFVFRVLILSFEMGTPSITYSGFEPAVMVPTPRTLMDNAAPGLPDPWET